MVLKLIFRNPMECKIVIEICGRETYSGRMSIKFFRDNETGCPDDLQSGSLEEAEQPRLLNLQGILPQKPKVWPGKTVPEDDRVRENGDLLKAMEAARFPDSWIAYGGWREMRFDATGFFRTHHDGCRWWLVDPDGFAFLGNK